MTSLHYQAKVIILSGKSSLLHYQAKLLHYQVTNVSHYPVMLLHYPAVITLANVFVTLSGSYFINRRLFHYQLSKILHLHYPPAVKLGADVLYINQEGYQVIASHKVDSSRNVIFARSPLYDVTA